jgi:glycosyltransferase involved in cell wall biosynthesis
MKVAVVTPTIGNPKFRDCLNSVETQTYQDLTHYVFIDGMEYFPIVEKMIDGYSKVKTITLEENVGKGWYGHRVFSACSFLVNADIICYLDEDNWYDPCHVEKLVNKIKEGNDWAYSLRKIYDKDGNFLCEDNCESLGKWPVYFNDKAFHIDTSSFAVKRDVAVRIGHAWYGQWGADRQFFHNLKTNFPNFACTNAHTMCYRLDGNPNSVTQEFFDKGNEINSKKYDGNFPWKQDRNLVKIGPGITILT